MTIPAIPPSAPQAKFTPPANNLVSLGDSITAYHWYGQNITSASRSAGVATIVSSSHQAINGQKMLICGFSDTSFNGFPTITRVDANTITYPNPGPDVGSASITNAQIRNPYWQFDVGYLSWARPASKNRVNLLYNAGIPGDTTNGMLARLQSDVFSYSPNYVSVMGGINDLTSSTPVATVFANLQSIYRQCRQRGIRVFALTVLPLETGHPSYSLAVQEAICSLNALIRQECKSQPSMILVDAFSVVVDPLSASCQPLTGYLQTDHIHPSARGAKAIGELLASSFNSVMPLVNGLISSGADNRAIGIVNSNFWPSLPSVPTGGTINNGTAHMTGVAPSGFDIRTSVGNPTSAVASAPARTILANGDTIGYNARCVFQAAANGDQIKITQSSSAWALTPASGGSAVSIGNAYILEFALDITGIANANIKEIFAFLNFTIDGNIYRSKILSASDTTFPITDIVGYVCQTPAFFLTGASITAMSIELDVTAGGAASSPVTIDMGRVSVREFPAGSVLNF